MDFNVGDVVCLKCCFEHEANLGPPKPTFKMVVISVNKANGVLGVAWCDGDRRLQAANLVAEAFAKC